MNKERERRDARLGGGILRYGLVVILLYLGSFKFTRIVELRPGRRSLL